MRNTNNKWKQPQVEDSGVRSQRRRGEKKNREEWRGVKTTQGEEPGASRRMTGQKRCVSVCVLVCEAAHVAGAEFCLQHCCCGGCGCVTL